MNNLQSEQLDKLLTESRKVIERQLQKAVNDANAALIPGEDGKPAAVSRVVGFDSDGEPILDNITSADFLQCLLLAKEQLSALSNIQEICKKE